MTEGNQLSVSSLLFFFFLALLLLAVPATCLMVEMGLDWGTVTVSGLTKSLAVATSGFNPAVVNAAANFVPLILPKPDKKSKPSGRPNTSALF